MPSAPLKQLGAGTAEHRFVDATLPSSRNTSYVTASASGSPPVQVRSVPTPATSLEACGGDGLAGTRGAWLTVDVLKYHVGPLATPPRLSFATTFRAYHVPA